MTSLSRILAVVLAFALSCSVLPGADACHPQFEKELRYLDLYLGIRPDNNGEIPQKDAVQFATYLSTPDQLNCDFEGECLWRNAPSDGLLDTSDWWFFQKSDDKAFPVQIQPGRHNVSKGEHLLVAGNTTASPEGAVLTSAPIACQKGFANFTFSYWLHNHAQIEVVILRAMNRRRHLQVLLRPKMKCDFIEPSGEECRVEIPPIKEPFRIGIRAYNLKDNVMGSMALISHIRYHGKICQDSPFPSYFQSLRLPPYEATSLTTMADLNCERPLRSCRWSNKGRKGSTQWRVGRTVDLWDEMFEIAASKSHPNSSFIFLAVDSFSPRPYPILQSQLIPCTQRTSSLTINYWLKAGTQAEVCAVDEDGVSLSCAYLTDEDSPGPISIDVDAFDRPFRFTMEIIAFDENSLGLVAVSGLSLAGLLCSEPLPPVVTTINPPTVQRLFGLQAGAGRFVPYQLSLDCDFSADYCSQWVNDDGVFQYGVAPRDSEFFPVPREIRGNVGVFVMRNASNSVLRSRQVPCAQNAVIDVLYMKSDDAQMRLCALNQCVDGVDSSGVVSIAVSSLHPFYVTIESSSRRDAVVVVSQIVASGDICPLKTAEQTACSQLQCTFPNSLCNYETTVDRPGDLPIMPTDQGASVTLNGGGIRSVLLSPQFDLPAASLLSITFSQSTFGSRVLLCPDADSEINVCHELAGPRVLDPAPKTVSFPLDVGARRFAIVMFHDKSLEFGAATFGVKAIDVRRADDSPMCLSTSA